MLSWLFGPKAEARQLNRDAKAIADSTRYGFRAEMQAEIAWQVHHSLQQSHVRGGDDVSAYKPIIDHFKLLHREARRNHNQVQLTANTLIIIYLRAEQLAELATPARAHIDELIGDWAHTFEEREVDSAM